METEAKKAPRGLAPGQVWKLDHAYLYIVQFEKLLVHYRMLREPEQRTALTRLIRMDALTNFLRLNDAELWDPAPASVPVVSLEPGHAAPLRGACQAFG